MPWWRIAGWVLLCAVACSDNSTHVDVGGVSLKDASVGRSTGGQGASGRTSDGAATGGTSGVPNGGTNDAGDACRACSDSGGAADAGVTPPDAVLECPDVTDA